MKSARSTFPRPEPRRAGNAFIIASMLLSLCALSLIKDRFCSATYAKSQASTELESIKMVTAKSGDFALKRIGVEMEHRASSGNMELQRPICVETSKRSNVCEAEGDLRIKGSSQTIFLHPSLTSQEWKTKPYARKHDQFALSNVKEWTIKPFPDHEPAPTCTENYTVPVVVFSIAGFTGNLFHDFTDVLVPLFITSYQFGGEVQFVVADGKDKSWWLSKFSSILSQLSKYEIIDADGDQDAVRCFPRVIAGLSFHKELGVDPARTPGRYSVVDFKEMLRKAYGLERANAEPSGDEWDVRRKPRLLIISRKSSRAFLNERGMSDMAMSLGFDVRIAEPEITTDLGKFARLVNTADVMIGVHGAGLTNMVFLPSGAVFIQVVPMGNLQWLARDTFEEPSPEMKLKYLDYRIQADESTLSDQYPKDHPVFTDPQSIHKKGWNELSRVYLENQNVKPHLGRLRLTLLEALKFLPHSRNTRMAQ
ncbi:protein O-linked-mannose beta-1,4-N-acetylglucosaminyltransferase 2 [Canna indica]|uniref:Protein O-linked-mannose beta-1,4-N-acetylglucosaminyltransferase 2 n=1 Tax=Canna indica TaxID=4628 RepID=A0AAQ3JNI8_9LILI|nr:protein O-linked-mannose beta-1,4-N-acetylglucosaminyltransferase 2 [Canna indica]